jgi:hypothetical protein
VEVVAEVLVAAKLVGEGLGSELVIAGGVQGTEGVAAQIAERVQQTVVLGGATARLVRE